MNIGIIGLGNMGSMIATSLKKNTNYQIYCYEKYNQDSKKQSIDSNLRLMSSIEELNLKVDYIILCTKPSQYEEVCSQIKQPTNLISILAGVKTYNLKKILPNKSKVVRVMPNIALLVGKSTNAIYGDVDLYDITINIFSNLGTCLEVKNEEAMDVVTGLSGSGIAYIAEFIDNLSLSGVYNGLSYKESLSIVLQTMEGCIDLLKKSDMEPSQLRNKISSPGGTTIEGLKKLKENRFGYTVMEAIKASVYKSKNIEN